MPSRRDPITGKTRRGVSNGNERGSAVSRRTRKIYLLDTYRANVDVLTIDSVDLEQRLDAVVDADLQYAYQPIPGRLGVGIWLVPHGYGEMAARCYRCGDLLVLQTITTDRIVPGCKKTAKFPKGGTYRRDNIRPACGSCNSETGGALARGSNVKAKHKVRGRRGHAPTLTILDVIEQSERNTA